MRADPVQWQQGILQKDHELFDNLPTDRLIFTDTSFIEDVVFSRRAGIHLGPNIEQWLQTKRYKKVFFLEPLALHEVTDVRVESQAVSRQISQEVEAEYERYGYELVRVTACPLSERIAYVLSHLAEIAG